MTEVERLTIRYERAAVIVDRLSEGLQDVERERAEIGESLSRELAAEDGIHLGSVVRLSDAYPEPRAVTVIGFCEPVDGEYCVCVPIYRDGTPQDVGAGFWTVCKRHVVAVG